MFDTVAMSRLTVAAPVGRMAEVLRACTELGCVHIESYTNFEDGVNVGQASSSEEANRVSSLLAKVRAAISAFKPVNADGPVPLGRIKELLEGSFADELQTGLDLLDTHRDSEAELEVLDEQIHLLRRLAPRAARMGSSTNMESRASAPGRIPCVILHRSPPTRPQVSGAPREPCAVLR